MSDPASPKLRADPFWVVWCPTAGPPTYKHATERSAVAESERLAQLHPGHRFVVLQSVSAVMVGAPLLRIDLRPNEPTF